MSQENVELTYRAFEMFNRRDLDGFLALMAEDVRVVPQLAPIEGRYDGHDGIRRWWKSLFDGIPDFTTEVVEVRDLGDDLILAEVRQSGHGAGSTVGFKQTTWSPARWRQGECIWWGVFLTEGDALKAAGLSE
jgi:ketosteroid isomerase-like protein